jgi:hypothetical protein
MIDLARMFDNYNRYARLYPALIALLPAVITVLVRYPIILTSNAAASLMTVAVSCGLLYLLAAIARSLGKNVERRLLQQWGGWPTTLWLRHSDSNLPRQTKERYHATFVRRVPGLRLPGADEERADPAGADDAYRSAVEWLKEQCRGKDYPLVEKENADYGFRRNLLGLKPLGLVLASTGLMASAIWIGTAVGLRLEDLSSRQWQAIAEQLRESPAPLMGVLLLNASGLVFWICVVRDTWVRQAGDQYARALLANCDRL